MSEIQCDECSSTDCEVHDVDGRNFCISCLADRVSAFNAMMNDVRGYLNNWQYQRPSLLKKKKWTAVIDFYLNDSKTITFELDEDNPTLVFAGLRDATVLTDVVVDGVQMSCISLDWDGISNVALRKADE